jgi:hypothetical protein
MITGAAASELMHRKQLVFALPKEREMTEYNCCSLEMSKKLVEAGIVLETEYYWIRIANSPMMLMNSRYGADEYYPTPSMSELWRELPEYITNGSTIQYLEMGKTGSKTYAAYDFADDYVLFDNPADALAELLIWVKEEKI